MRGLHRQGWLYKDGMCLQSADDSSARTTKACPAFVTFFTGHLSPMSCPVPDMGRPGIKPSQDTHLTMQPDWSEVFGQQILLPLAPQAGQALMRREQQHVADGGMAPEGEFIFNQAHGNS